MDNKQNTNPVVASSKPSLPFGPASFSWPEKQYSSKDGKTRTYARVIIPILGSVLNIETVIWETKTIQDGNPVTELSLGLPRGIMLADNKSDELKDILDTYKMDTLTAFDGWENSTKDGKPAVRLMPRLVRKATTETKK